MNISSPLIVVLARDEYDLLLCDDLAKELEPTYTHPNVIVDFSNVTYIDSTCLSRFVRMYKERTGRGFHSARFVIASKNIRNLFAILKFDAIWPVYESLEDALRESEGEFASPSGEQAAG
jgi:anti-anti-sigma factor